jgi:uncharacterized protein
MSSTMATTLPPESIRITTDPWTDPFWQAAKEDRLTACKCASCGTFRHPPSPFCPQCQSQAVEWPTLSGRGSVFSYSVVRGFPGLPEITMVPVVVEFDDAPGVHLVSNLVDIDPADVAIGMAIDVDFITITDGWKLPVFHAARA